MIKEIPHGDLWLIVDDDKSSQSFNQSYRFDFSYITPPAIRRLVKAYIFLKHRKREKTLSGLYTDLKIFQTFMRFADAEGMQTLVTLTNANTKKFMSYLATTVSSTTGTPLKKRYQKSCFDTLKKVVRFGQREEMSDLVPQDEIFSGREYRGVNKHLQIDFIPDSIVRQINEYLPQEPDIYTKSIIEVLQMTGMRIGDLLKLPIGRTGNHPIDGGPTLRYFVHKTRKGKTIKVPQKCVDAIKAVEAYTAILRDEAPSDIKDLLLIYRSQQGVRKGDIIPISPVLARKMLKRFCARNDINDVNGEPYDLTCHHFRRTLGTDMLSKGLSFKAISNQLSIDPRNLPKFYSDVKDVERSQVFQKINIVGNPDDIDERFVPDPEELKQFKANIGRGARMCDGYCTKPIEEEKICDRLLKRRRCYSCRRYITTPEFLDYHRSKLAEIEVELENNTYGEHYASHLRPLAIILRQIISELEAIKL